MRLECDDLTITINGQTLVARLDLDIAPGSFVCILGTNGVGKTLTLHTIAGLRDSPSGEVRLGGDPLSQLSRREIARRLGLLLQIHEDAFPLTVLDSALMGRYPHMGMWQWPGQADTDIVHNALQTFDLTGLEPRLLNQLSGGERERVALATLMVQDPAIWLLDEPMNHLDPQHQLAVLRTLQSVAMRDRVILASLHNPGLARRFADYALLLYGDGEWEFGPVSDVLDPARMERVYQTPFDFFRNGDQITLLPV
jgi:iron complex transport system ATP-binding protein